MTDHVDKYHPDSASLSEAGVAHQLVQAESNQIKTAQNCGNSAQGTSTSVVKRRSNASRTISQWPDRRPAPMPTIHNAAFSDSPNTNVKHDLKTDKLTLVNDLPDMLKEGIVSYYLGLIKDQELIAYHAISRSYSPGCRGYEVSLEGKVPLKTSPLIWSTEAGYLLQVGGKKGRPTLRLDINPLALTLTG